MSKKSIPKTLDIEMALENKKKYKKEIEDKPERLVLFTRRTVLSRKYRPDSLFSDYKVFDAGQYTIDEEIIEELLKIEAPIEIYERVK